MVYQFATTDLQGVEAMTSQDKLKQRIRERLDATRLSANKASRMAGLGISYANDLLTRPINNPDRKRLSQLAEVLECDVAYLLGEIDEPRADGSLAPRSAPAPGPALPLYTTNLVDPDGWSAMETSTYTLVPFLVADPDAYAVAVTDGANAPRFLAGEVVVASPRRPVVEGKFGVIHATDGRAMIRRIDTIEPGGFEVTDLRSGEKQRLDRSQVAAVHRIIAVLDV